MTGIACPTIRGAKVHRIPVAFRMLQRRALASDCIDTPSAPPIETKKKNPVRILESARSAAKVRPPVSPGSSTSNASGSKVHHPAHHFMDGGMPCDPAPPRYSLAEYGEESLYTLILLRHGESEWNSLNRYTGWCDVELTATGRQEARTAGRLLYENNIEIDQAFTSVLKRASFSCNMALNAAQQHWVPVTKTWRLNERHYGALQGYNKDAAWKELGLDQELVMQMRRAYATRPPRMPDEHPFWHGNDRRYRKLTPEQLEASRAESLQDAAKRILPFFNSVITPSIQSGKKCLIVSHANTIRTLVKHIDGISDEDIKGMTIPTGIPLLYRLDKNMRPVDPQIELEFRYMVEPKGYVVWNFQYSMFTVSNSIGLCKLESHTLSILVSYTWGTSRAHGFHGVYLGDLERLQGIQKKRDATNRDWQKVILRNIGKSLGWLDMGEDEETTTAPSTPVNGATGVKPAAVGPNAVETRQLWWQVHEKMKSPEYRNMLLLMRMQSCLEELMYERKQKFITQCSYESLIRKIHLDTEGCVVEPFVDLADRQNRDARQQLWYENLALDMEEECLIK